VLVEPVPERERTEGAGRGKQAPGFGLHSACDQREPVH
jgi:hypothetical protein